MPVDSLVDIARRACMKSSRGITDIGDIPYDLLRPVLLKIENPEQLRTLEQNSPQIIGKDREIWLSMLKRDIPDYENKPHEPSDPKNWWKVYRKLKKETQEDMAAGDAKLKAALSSAQAKGGPTTKILTQAQLPRQAPRRRQAMTYDYLSGRTGSKGAHKSTLMEKIRKETKGASTTKMSRPTHELQKKSSGVVKPPQSFVRDIRQQNLAKVPLADARRAMGYAGTQASKPLPHPAGASYDLTQDREARLRSLKSRKQTDQHIANCETGYSDSDGVNHLTLDFLEDDDDDDDDLFGASAPNLKSSGKKGSPQMRSTSPQTASSRKRLAPNVFMSNPAAKRKRPSPDVR